MPVKRLDQRLRRLAGETLEDRSLVQRHNVESVGIELIETIIVTDVDAGTGVGLLADHARLISPTIRTPFCLASNRQRRQDQCAAIRCLNGLLAEFQLHLGLAEARVEEAAAGADL